MRFIGNKENLISKIYDFMCECKITNQMLVAQARNHKAKIIKTHTKKFLICLAGVQVLDDFLRRKALKW